MPFCMLPLSSDLRASKFLASNSLNMPRGRYSCRCIDAAIAEGHKHKHLLKMTSYKKASIVWSAPEATVQQCHYTAAIAWLC